MKDRLLKLLGVESGEESMVIILLSQSIFLGIFFGAFDISAHSFFLAIFDEKMMARGYVVSGIAGILLTSVYTWLQTRIRFKRFAIINLLFVTIITLLLWITLLLNPSRWVIFMVFIMLGPLNILAALGFWGTVGRLFTLRQGKRLFGLVDAGLIIGIIISCYAIPVLLSLNFESHNILLVSAASVFMAAIIQIITGSRFSLQSAVTKNRSEQDTKKKSVFSVFRESSYIRIMGLFIALSVVTAFFVQYSFMAVTREQYPSEADMARFLGLFTGSMMIFTLLIKVLVFSYIIRNYGLRTCLALSPILVAAFTAIAIGIGMFMGYTPLTGGFLLFFLILALSRLFSKSLKDSIESPSFKVIYQTIDEKIRYNVQSAMDGTVNEIAALASGLILAGLGILSFIRLIHFSLVLFIIIVIWIFVAIKLYSEYRKSIRKALETVNSSVSDGNILTSGKILRNKYCGERAFICDYFKLITGDFSQIENNSKWYFEKLIDYSVSNNDINLLPALKIVAGNTNLNEEIRKRSEETIKNLETHSGYRKPSEEKLLGSRKILAGNRTPQTTEILRLLRDNSFESKKLAIFMIGKFKLADLLPEVCECLNIAELQSDASDVLGSFGPMAYSELTKFYLISSGNINTSKTILRLLGRSFSEENSAFLFSRLWSNSRQVKEIAVTCLKDIGYKVSEEEKDRLHQFISDVIGYMTWNISARVCLQRVNNELILSALNKEINRWNNFLFNILAITYDSGSITKIRANLESATVESINFALEMIDIVIDDSIKPKLVLLLDVVSDEEKIKNLHQFFPGEIPHYDKLTESIINRDYNLLSIWIKTCTLRSIPELDNENIAESVVALLFSPEVILQEESARLIARSGSTLYWSVSERIPFLTKQKLDRIVNGERSQNDLLFEKVKFLGSCFEKIPEDELLFLASEMKYFDRSDPELQTPDNGCIIWYLSDNHEAEVFICHNENLMNTYKEVQRKETGFIYMLLFDTVEEYHQRFPEKSQEIFTYIDMNEEKPVTQR
jgi:ATP/ADP translocase